MSAGDLKTAEVRIMYRSVNSQRYGKAKDMKVKHLVQLVALTVLFTWFLYQLNSSHKAKVRSLRAKKDDDIDDELLISSDSSVPALRAGNRLDHEEGEVAHEEFIDTNSVFKSRKELRPLDTAELEQVHDVADELLITSDNSGPALGARTVVDRGADAEAAHEEFIDIKSVFKSRKELRPLDAKELEQSIAEGERVEDVLLDGSGEGDGDERANSEGIVRRDEETEVKTRGEEGDDESLRKWALEKMEVGEDEQVDRRKKELNALKERPVENLTGKVGDDITENPKEESIEKELVEMALKNPSEPVADEIPNTTTKLSGSESSEHIVILRTGEVKKNLSKQDDAGMDNLQVINETKTESATQGIVEEAEGVKNLGHNEALDQESIVTPKLSPKSPYESSRETLHGPAPSMQNGADSETKDLHLKVPADAKIGQRSGVDDILRTKSSADDGTATSAEDGNDPGDVITDGKEKLKHEADVDLGSEEKQDQ